MCKKRKKKKKKKGSLDSPLIKWGKKLKKGDNNHPHIAQHARLTIVF